MTTTTQHRMTQHRIVGYDPVSERPVYSLEIPNYLLGKFIRFEDDDPEGFDTYKLHPMAARDMIGMLKAMAPSKELEYFIEPSES
jgi:hypothetical protein